MNTGLPPKDWDKQLQQLGGHFLQSRPWAEFQAALGREVIWSQSGNWMWLAALRGQKGLKYMLCSYGPAASNATMALEALQSLQDAAKSLGCDFVRVEPRDLLQASQMRDMSGRRIGEVQPMHTQVINLTKSEADLRRDVASGHRNLINGTQRRGVSIRESNKASDIDEFREMLHETAKYAKVTFYPDKYYRTLIKTLMASEVAKLYVAEARINDQGLKIKDGNMKQPVAMALFYDWGDTRYYVHAGAHQELNREAKASVSLVWQAVMDAKKVGIKRFDLWGVAPNNDPKHLYAGISKFKKAFGGTPVDYVGTWDLPLKPVKYQVYSMYRKLKGRD